MPSAAEKVKKFTRNMLNYINGDLVGRTNLTNFAAENLKANFRAAENIELLKIRATDQVAINII